MPAPTMTTEARCCIGDPPCASVILDRSPSLAAARMTTPALDGGEPNVLTILGRVVERRPAGGRCPRIPPRGASRRFCPVTGRSTPAQGRADQGVDAPREVTSPLGATSAVRMVSAMGTDQWCDRRRGRVSSVTANREGPSTPFGEDTDWRREAPRLRRSAGRRTRWRLIRTAGCRERGAKLRAEPTKPRRGLRTRAYQRRAPGCRIPDQSWPRPKSPNRQAERLQVGDDLGRAQWSGR